MLGKGKIGESFSLFSDGVVYLLPSTPLAGTSTGTGTTILEYVYYGTDTQNVAAFVRRATTGIAYYTPKLRGSGQFLAVRY